MDGDSPDLSELRSLCDRFDAALYVDEAHALGVFGPGGAGLCKQAGVVPDVFVGTLGKAVGVQGAFVAGTSILADFLWNRARGFVFTTASSPLLSAVTLERVQAIRADAPRRTRLLALCDRLATRLVAAGVPLRPDRFGPIFPIELGDPTRAAAVARTLGERGFLAQAIRPPTVPTGTARLRVTLHADLPEDTVDRLAADLAELCRAS
jgi:8-amino-7-oxononanoate synthase